MYLKLTVTLEGASDKIEQTLRQVDEYLSQISSSGKIGLGSNIQKQFLIRNGLKHESVKQRIKQFEDNRQCLVDFELFQSSHFSDHYSMDQPIMRNMSDSCRVLIKPDKDVTNESSHILVCPIMENVRQKTAVLHRFDTVCGGIMNELISEYDRSNGATIFKTRRNLNGLKSSCKAVIHVMMKRWNKTNNVESVRYLEKQIIDVLHQAVSLGATSISFPVIGYGRAFQFPAHEAAQTALNAVQIFLNTTKLSVTLSEIVFLAPEYDLFTEFRKCLGATDQDVVSITCSRRNMSQIKTDFDLMLDESCCGFDTISIDAFKHLPQPSSIEKSADELGLLIEKKINSNDKIEYKISGVKENRKVIIDCLQKYFSEVSESFPKKPIRSITETRGSLKFLKCAGESDEEFPSYWSLHCVDYFLRKIDKPSTYVKCQVDKRTSDAISTLISNLWTGNRIGRCSARVISNSLT